jgi:GH15 family glucan-1,4-alpha-glucosidase
MTTTDRYLPIEDHGLIGDLQTAALVGTDGSIDWLCLPRFDSPSIFAALVDADRGGRFRVAPAREGYTTRQMYLGDTAILITRFLSESGVGEVIDFLPPAGDAPTDHHQLVRMVHCVRGRMEFVVDIAPRFDYGRRAHETHVTDHGAVFESGPSRLTVHVVREPGSDSLVRDRLSVDGDVHLTLPLDAGQIRGVILEWGGDGPPREVPTSEVQRLFAETARFWREWLRHSTYTGRWREMVDRAAITLKLMTYAPSGAIVAAPTAGLPEQVGGERNWDYRYTWVRDGSFSVYSLLAQGFTEEAAAFAGWLRDRVEERVGGEGGPLNIMYRVDGSSDLVEEKLDHWEGYRGSSPVRIGNGAADQLQLDIYDEALDSIAHADEHGLQIGQRGWGALTEVLDWVAENWDQPDEGIWETRGGRQDFTYGRVMTWVALDRGIALASQRRRPAPLARWIEQRDRIYQQVMDRGWDRDKKAFIQQYGSPVLDSSLLRMPTVGFVAPEDPMWLSTLDAIDAELVSDSLVYRYDPEASPDGLRGSEGTFSLCTFNYVDALARAGRTEQARIVFEKMLTYANHLGLYSEEIGPAGEQLGNFPQAFTHLALIDAARTLDAALSRR